MHQSQALGSGLELAVLSWALRTEIARGSWHSRASHIGQVIGKNKKIGTSKISALLKTWVPFGNLDSHLQTPSFRPLIHFYGGVTALVDKGRAMDVIYLDFCKAFDIVPPTTLPLKWRDMDLMGGPLGG